MATLTGANCVLTLSQPTLFPVPQQIQGFAADDVFNVDAIRSAEVVMGVDGRLSAGFVYAEVPQNVMLQADSQSIDFFDTIWLQGQAAQDVYELNGLIILPGVATKFTLTRGFLTNYPPVPAVKKILQPRAFQITWERIAPAPLL